MKKNELDRLNSKIQQKSTFIESLREGISEVIVGQNDLIDKILISIISNGHILLEGVPGLAKTLTINTVANLVNADFKRIQFTPDMLPSDLLGTLIYNQKTGEFNTKKGPIFSNIILADEINRAPSKVQSALLESMQEKQVTIGDDTFKLSKPFLVLATQNPIEQEGTYPLPEAQLDRFMYSIFLDYPTVEEEIDIVKKTTLSAMSEVKALFTIEEILKYQNLILEIPVNNNVIQYAVELVNNTRPNRVGSSEYINKYISFGAGPRASQYLVLGAKINAILAGKYSPDIEDVQQVASWVLAHRLVKNYKAESEGVSTNEIIQNLL